MHIRDGEKMWIICDICNKAFDVREGKKCECGNVKTHKRKDGSVFIFADDSDEVYYDNDR